MTAERIAAVHGPAFAALALCAALVVPLFGIDPTGPGLLAAVVLAVALVGIPHGALDPALARWAGLWSTPAGLAGFLGVYTALGLAALALWMLSPFAALVVFLALSAFHFSGDWADGLTPVTRLAAGVVVVALPTFLHPEPVGWVFGAVAPSAGTPALVSGLQILAPVALGILAALLARDAWRGAARGRAVIEVAAVALLALAVPPLVFFAVYFAGLHSPRHGIEVMAAFPRRDRRFAVAAMVLTTLATFAWAAVAWWLMRPVVTPDVATLRLVFVGLFVLTVPHMALCALTDRRVHAAANRVDAAVRPAPPQATSAATSAIASERSPTI